jgi:hypothetical protein
MTFCVPRTGSMSSLLSADTGCGGEHRWYVALSAIVNISGHNILFVPKTLDPATMTGG